MWEDGVGCRVYGVRCANCFLCLVRPYARRVIWTGLVVIGFEQVVVGGDEEGVDLCGYGIAAIFGWEARQWIGTGKEMRFDESKQV